MEDGIRTLDREARRYGTLRKMLSSGPALAWMKDDKAVALFVKGMNTEQFLTFKGLRSYG